MTEGIEIDRSTISFSALLQIQNPCLKQGRFTAVAQSRYARMHIVSHNYSLFIIHYSSFISITLSCSDTFFTVRGIKYKLSAYSITMKGELYTSVEIIKRNGSVTAVISGELDHCEAAGIRMQIDPELEHLMPTMLILDMSGVTFMDSSGIGLILGRQRVMESLGGGITVKNPSPSVRRILQVAGLSRLIISGKKTEE